MNAIIETNWILTINNLFYKMWEFLYNNWLTVNIKWKIYPNRTWFRQLAMYLWISLEITKETRIETTKYFLYEYSVKAISKDWRYAECSASCSSNEREFNNKENDVRATAQTRATNRAIADLLWISDITKYIKNKSSDSNEKWDSIKSYNKNVSVSVNEEDTNITKESITLKQKELIEKLVTEIAETEEEKQAYLENIDELTKREANSYIKELLEERKRIS